MSHPPFDRWSIRFKPLSERKNRVLVPRDLVSPDSEGRPLAARGAAILHEAADRIRAARSEDRPVICAFGAHAIKNGLGPVLTALMSEGWLTHLATNGAGIIHDWEIAFQGKTSEDVRENVTLGEFGIWEETGRYLNLGLLVGAWEGLGYGQSIGGASSVRAGERAAGPRQGRGSRGPAGRDCSSGHSPGLPFGAASVS